MATINGDEDDDVLPGTPDHDIINGGGGDDTINGAGGNDTLSGEAGDDTFTGATGDGHDRFFGGDGFDRILWSGTVSFMGGFSLAENSVERIVAETITSFSSSSNTLDFRGVDLQISGEIGGGAAHNTIYAGDGADLIRGGGGDDTLHGLGGDDVFLGATGDGRDVFFGGDGFDRIDWGGDGELYLRGGFGAANGVELIRAHSVTGFTSSSSTLDFSRVAFDGVAFVRGDDGVYGVGHNKVVASLSRIPGIVYDGGGGGDRVTVTLAPSDFAGASGSPLAGLIKDIGQSRTGSFGNATGFVFDDSLGLTVKNFNQGLSYGWFTLAGALAEAPLANVRFAVGAIAGTAGNDVLASTTNNLDTYLAGDGDDLILHASGGPDRFVTGAGDDTIIVVGDRGGRINDPTDTGGAPEEGLDQMFVVDGGKFSLGGQLRGIERIEFLSAGGAGQIVSSGTNIQPDFTHTTLAGVNLVKGGVNNDTFVTAREHHDVGGGVIAYDGGNTVPYDAVTVSLGDFTQLDVGSGLRTDLGQLLAAPNVSVNGFTFDTAFDGFDLRIVNIGDNRKDLDAARVKLGWIGHDGEIVQAAPTAETIVISPGPGGTQAGTEGNDIWLRGGNQSRFDGLGGDDLMVAFSGFGSVGIARLDGGDGSDTYLVRGQSAQIIDTGDGVGDHDRILAVTDGAIVIGEDLAGIEEIDANGFDARLSGTATGDVFDFRGTAFVGIALVETGGNGDTVHTDSKAGHVAYDGGATASDRLNFYLTDAQAEDAGVLAEIAAFKAATPAERADWTFDALDFTTRSFETVRFWDGDTLV